MQTLYVMCGIPASGKSTKSKQLAKKYGLTRFSFDEMGCYTTRQFLRPVVEALKNGEDVIMDSTHLKANSRKVIFQAVENIPCRKICIFMDTPFDECLHRNANRDARVPDMAMEAMNRTIESPTLEEGWDEILYY